MSHRPPSWRSLALTVLACTLLFGPERIPLDGITHWEIRGSLCTRNNEPWIIVETRTYERVIAPDGKVEIRVPGPKEEADAEGWRLLKETRLYVTTSPPAPFRGP